MAAEITPEPQPAEREVILRALAAVGLGSPRVPPPYASPWRRAGLAENASGGAAAEQARSDPGVVEP